MLLARPVNFWWSEDWRILQGDEQRALIRPDSGGRFLIEVGEAQYEGRSNVPHQVHPSHGSLCFTLIDQTRSRVAAAYVNRWSLARWQYNIPHNGRLHAVEFNFADLMTNRYPCTTDSVETGVIRAVGNWLRGEWGIDLPDELPVYLRVFMGWLVFRPRFGEGA